MAPGIPSALRAADNGGLGPLPVRNLFPPALPYLNFTPEPVLTLAPSKVQFSYQYAVANTLVNTQSGSQPGTPVITQANVDRGLTTADFPAVGYGAFIDVEAQVHLLRWRYGLTDSLEVGLDQSWVSYGGGGLDQTIESVESAFSALNPLRPQFARNGFHYFLARDGKFLVATEAPADLVPADPVLSMKWNWTQGGNILPAISLRLTYKAPLDNATSLPRSLVSSGSDDFGYYLLFSKAIGNWVVHYQTGETQLTVRNHEYASSLEHKLFGLEYRSDRNNSWVMQITTQSSIFNTQHADSVQSDFQISRPTDVFALGYKHLRDGFLFNFGFVEDYNSSQNETDVVALLELGWQW